MSTETIEPEADGQTYDTPTGEDERPQAPPSTPDPMGENPEAERRLALYENHVAELKGQHEKVARLRVEHEQAKAEAKRAKEALETALDELDALAAKDPTFGPLFEGEGSADGKEQAEPWREERLGSLVEHGAPKGTVQKIGEHLDLGPGPEAQEPTLGQLSDLINRGHGWWESVQGVGEAKAVKVQEALQAWFAANPEKCGQSSEDGDREASEGTPLSTLDAYGLPPKALDTLKRAGFTTVEQAKELDAAQLTRWGMTEDQQQELGVALGEWQGDTEQQPA